MLGLLLFSLKVRAWDGNDPEQIRDYTSYVSQKEGISVSLLQGIIHAESDWNPQAHNPEGSASGVLQFLDSTFRKQCIEKYHVAWDMSQKDNPFVQINCAVEMLKEPRGYLHWEPSMASWKGLLITQQVL